ncbi:TonB-dependent receptor domain-containing protein [Sphingosinicella rhizophila]|uniref:TonB-dependent receptor n=1 Tax=Sphingosinicella rhizophila TaxID=3050082 RepID=A0ABU3Q2D9_9SPHN|nr:TonB-dependent receptor [Sphingosinicella sp. GR2756]MDT9597588.1 TonB-dependent receptor [Sphingosinicella sp. GR2756]
MSFQTLAKRFPTGGSVIALVVALAAAPVVAQESAQPQAEAVEPGSDDQAGDVTTLVQQEAAASDNETIVVTGSRIRRSEYNSPDPITIINPELGRLQGQTQTVEILQSSPIASGSVQITSAISNNYVTNGGADAQTISLRGLGAERTLVLLNGRRAGPAGVRGGVASFDLNVLPLSIVRSVEILKTGASSIYGSDAVAGVVNILTKRDTDGVEWRGFTSIPLESGGEQYSMSLTYGKDFGRGHFLVSGDYFRMQDLRRNDRKFLGCQEEFLTFRGGGRADITDFRTGRPACNGVIGNTILTNNDFSEAFGLPGLFAPNGEQLFIGQYSEPGSDLSQVGVAFNSIPGIVAPANFYGLNFDGPSTGAVNQYLSPERFSDVFSDVERYTLYGEGSYEVTDGIELFAEFLYNKRKTRTDSYSQVSSFQFTGNSFLPAFFCAPTDFNCDPGDAGDPFNNEFEGNFLLRPLILVPTESGTNIDYYRGVLGARGSFGGSSNSNWEWNAYGQYSRSSGKYFQDVTLADSIFTQDFRTRSCVGLVTPVAGRPCIDIDFTDPRVLRGDFTSEERAFLFGREVGKTIYEQWAGEASITGTVVNLPAGSLDVALGGTLRRDSINDAPGEFSQAGNVYNLSSAGITAGKTLSKELFGEVQIPLIHNTPLIQRFTLSGAARYTAVDATRRDGVEDNFSSATWKLGFDWEVNDWLKFRGSWGTSFRAPALFELFLERQTGFQAQQDVDICIEYDRALQLGTISQQVANNCAAVGIPGDFTGATGGVTVVEGGGIGNLEPERSEAKTFSVVLTPQSWLWGGMRARLAVDYFDIEVKDEITRLGASAIVVGCYDSDFFPDEPLCQNIVRAPAGSSEEFNITDISDTYININRQRNRGIDVTGEFVQDLGRHGTLTFIAQMTWQLKDKLYLFANTEDNLNGEDGEPKWTGDFTLLWETAPWKFFYSMDVVGGTSNIRNLIEDEGSECRTSIFRPGGEFCPDVRLSPTFYHSASITREINERFDFTIGVSNLFNQRPPRASTVFNGRIQSIGQAPAFGSQYDYLGRRVFASVVARF